MKYDAYKAKSSDISNKIETYKAKQTAYYVEFHKTGHTDKTDSVIAAKKLVVKAAEALKTDDAEADKANLKLVDQYVQDTQEEKTLFDELIPDANGQNNGNNGQR